MKAKLALTARHWPDDGGGFGAGRCYFCLLLTKSADGELGGGVGTSWQSEQTDVWAKQTKKCILIVSPTGR